MSKLIDNIKRLAGMVKNETKSGGNTAVRVGGLFEEIATELENKYDKTETDSFVEELDRKKLDKVGDGKDITVTFSEASERTNVASGEKLSVFFGKVWTWFSLMKPVAFSAKASDLQQDDKNRFVTDAEKVGWNDKYTQKQSDTKDAAMLLSAKNYADNIIGTLGADVYRKAETDSKDAAALQAAKEYTARKIAEVVNSAPGTLDTLQELATALGNDPNFATSIMMLIGGKADTVHRHTKEQIINFPVSMPASDVYSWAKQPQKPSYIYSEVGASPSGHGHRAEEILDTPEKVIMTTAEREKLANIGLGSKFAKQIDSLDESNIPGDYIIPANVSGGPLAGFSLTSYAYLRVSIYNSAIKSIYSNTSTIPVDSPTIPNLPTTTPSIVQVCLKEFFTYFNSDLYYYTALQVNSVILGWKKIYPVTQPSLTPSNNNILVGTYTNCNDYTTTGKYWIKGNETNAPVGQYTYQHLLLEVERMPDNTIYQTVKSGYRSTAGLGTSVLQEECNVFRRFFDYDNNNWTLWFKFSSASIASTPPVTTPSNTPSITIPESPTTTPTDPPTTTPVDPPIATPSTTVTNL